MKAIVLSVLAAAVVLAACDTASPTAVQPGRSHAVPSFTGTGACAPHGSVNLFIPNYDWIANGTPLSTDCWSPGYGDTFVTGVTTCGWSSNAIEFGYAGHISQEFTIPAGWTDPNFSVSFLLDFDDPNNDGAWNRYSLAVTDLTTGATLASEYFSGSSGDLYCSRRAKSWTGNLAGHTISVEINGSKAYTNTHIRVSNIALFQTS